MQLMTWMVGRLGSRFSLQFEPYYRRVMHSALGRFMDRPLDLAVGLVEPDGRQRVLPFTTDNDDPRVDQLANCEQFDRLNSVTFRGYSERYGLRLELNVHSAFYPQNERLCLMPAFYLEMRVSPLRRFRLMKPVGPTPREVELFIRLRREQTQIQTLDDAIHLRYDTLLRPTDPWASAQEIADATFGQPEPPSAHVQERLVSLNTGCLAAPEGNGLRLVLPVTQSGSGIKWRLVWAAHTPDPVLRVRPDGGLDQDPPRDARFRYTTLWPDVEAVAAEAIDRRDERLALSRRFEKLLEQAPLDASQRHLTNQTFQNFLGNTFWCTVQPPTDAESETNHDAGPPRSAEWFSVWDGSPTFHSAIDVEYNNSLFYLCFWPRLLKRQLHQWLARLSVHKPSNGAIAPHDLGRGLEATGDAYSHALPVEENANLLLLLETYTRWTGDTSLITANLEALHRLTRYLIWTDREASGYPTEGVANAMVDALPSMQYARKQTYLAVKRVAALRAAAGIFRRHDRLDIARQCERLVEIDTRQIEQTAWLGDHYAVAVDASAMELLDPVTDQPLPYDTLPGWDAYSIYTGNGLLLPEMIGQPSLLDRERLIADVRRANRECQGRYGDGHSSQETNNTRTSQNLWRDLLARYLHLGGESSAQQYWDMQGMSNTHAQSLGFTDTYIQNRLHNTSRGVASIGYYLASPRLIIDRLSAGDIRSYITVNPDRHTPSRWPLLPLADWQAGKIPVCVVHDDGRCTIEAPTDPVIVVGAADDPGQTLSGLELIG